MPGKKDMMGFLKKLGVKDSHMKEEIKASKTPDIVSEEDATLPTTEAHCPKCKNDEAQWWAKQMRASDEPETKFLKCTKCKHTWRDAS